MKPKLLLRYIICLLALAVCIHFLESKRKANMSGAKRSEISHTSTAKSSDEGINDFLFFESFSRYLFIPLSK